MFEWIVPPEDATKKIIVFLVDRLKGAHSSRFLKKALESNCCLVNDRTERFASYILATGDRIVFRPEKLSGTVEVKLQKIDPSRILYEDDSLLIYNKPPKTNSDENGILKILKQHRPGLQLIHRLDRDTTGVLLLAKNPIVFEKMVEEFKQLKVRKLYLAIVDGIPEKKKGWIDNYLGKKHVYEGQTIWGSVNKEKGLNARTDWVLVKQGINAALLRCSPRTGRTHQIRVHLSEMGHPILGDFQYVKKFRCNYRPARYLLHAYKIGFRHPITAQTVEIEAPIPEDFIKATQKIFN